MSVLASYIGGRFHEIYPTGHDARLQLGLSGAIIYRLLHMTFKSAMSAKFDQLRSLE